MTDDARRVAIAAIVRIDTEGAYANLLLRSLLDDTDLDARDRGFVTELVYGSTRRRRALDQVLDRYLVQAPPPAARAALRIGAYQLLELGTPPHAAVSATVAASAKRFRGLVNAVLRKVSALVGTEITYPSLAVELSYPDWVVERLVADLGEQRARAALDTMNQPAQVTTRADGYVQDPSSQLVAAAVPVSAGARVLDLCAAPGGKATALAAAGASVVAADLHPKRVGLIAANRAELQLDDLHLVCCDGVTPPFADASFDAVLVDAPCSGLGALRRRPDARWRISASDVDDLVDVQRRLLQSAATLVRPGGCLVYSVCTLTAAESSGVVGASAAALRELGFGPPDDLEQPWRMQDHGVGVLDPSAEADGMALARWHRAAGE